MKIDGQKQVQEQLSIRMKLLDDVFHNMIIALERLESFLEYHRKGDAAAEFAATGMHTPRDLHDDQKNPPTIESVLGEVQLQCSALFFQTEFDDIEFFKQTMKYFMTDLLEWYGGRGKDIPYDEVEMFVLPIVVSLSRQIDSITDIMKVVDDYVTKLPRIEDFSDEEKEQAIRDGFTAYLKGRDRVEQQMKEFEASGEEVIFSVHRRGTATDGYMRLMDAMFKLYNTTLPAKKIRATFTAYVEGLPDITDEMIEEAFASKGQDQDRTDLEDEAADILHVEPSQGQQEQGDVSLRSFQEEGCTYAHFFAKCPVCFEEGAHAPETFWKHHNCGGDIYAGDNARFKCIKCGKSVPMKNGQFSCPGHAGYPDHSSTPFIPLVSVICTSGRMTGALGVSWLHKTLLALAASEQNCATDDHEVQQEPDGTPGDNSGETLNPETENK